MVMATALALSVAGVPLSRFMGRSLGIMDEPGVRQVHQISTPRTGGWAVLVGFLTTVFVGYIVGPRLESLPWLDEYFGSAFAMLREAHKVQSKLLALLVGSL